MRDVLSTIEKAASAALLAVLVATIFAQVLSRFVFNFPLAWSEEISRYSFIWLTMIAAPLCIRARANIRMDVAAKLLPPNGVMLIELLSVALTLTLCIVLLVWGYRILPVVSHQLSPAIGIPMYWVYGAIPIGAFLMIIELLIALWDVFAKSRGDEASS
jgi:TRAP-type C4-dicarboxylate transport system permease small subunit